LLVATPEEAVGTVDVTVTTPAGTSALSAADQFTFRVPAPIVTGLSQTSGFASGGESIVISGLNFAGATAVFFGNTAAASFTSNLDGTPTAIAPAWTTVPTAPVDVTVETPSGTSAVSPADQFTITPAG